MLSLKQALIPGRGGGGEGKRENCIRQKNIWYTISIMRYVSQQVMKLIAGVRYDIYKIE